MREEDLRAVQARLVAAVRARLVALDLPAVVDELERLDARGRAVAFRLLPKPLSVRVLELLPTCRSRPARSCPCSG